MSLNSSARNRKHRRKIVYSGELHPITLFINEQTTAAEVADISVNGLSVLLPKETYEKFDLHSEPSILITAYNQIDTLPPQIPYKIVHACSLHRNQREFVKLGLEKVHTFMESNNHVSYPAPSAIKTIVTFEHPYFPLRIVYGEVQSLSPTAIRISTSLRNGDLIPSQNVRLTLNFPLLGNVHCYAYIKRVNLNKRQDAIDLDFELKSNLEDYQEKAVETLLMSPSTPSLKLLREQGFRVVQGSTAINFEYRSDNQDLKEIAALRMKALHYQGEMKSIQDPIELLDEYDKHSRHIIARLNHQIVAATRLIFNNGDPARVEHIKYGAKIPDWLWEAGFIEGGRLVTDPEYRGADIFLNITRFIGKTIITSGYKYMLSSCSKSLEKVYIRMGCRKIGTYVIHGDSQPWSLIVVDFENTSKGLGVNPIAWNIVFRPMVDFMIEKDQLKLNLFNKFQLCVYRWFAPITRRLLNHKTKIKTKKQKN